MSLHFTTGDMFDRPTEIRINTVNCVGVMGVGVAMNFKQRYPKMFLDYKAACKKGLVKPGYMHVFKVSDDYSIVNFPTKRHWREDSRYEDIYAGLVVLNALLLPLGSVSATMPALGCGNGGLDWEKVKGMIVRVLKDTQAEIWVYSPEDSRR